MRFKRSHVVKVQQKRWVKENVGKCYIIHSTNDKELFQELRAISILSHDLAFCCLGISTCAETIVLKW